MKVKVIAALVMTVAMTLAAFASEQRRMCYESAAAHDQTVIVDESREATIIAMSVDVAN